MALLLLLAASSTDALASPSSVASAVAGAFLANQTNFLNWEGGFQYGGAVVADGLYEAQAQFGGLAWTAAADHWSDAYLAGPPDNRTTFDCSASFPYGAANNTKTCAWQLRHNVSIDHGGTIGDHVALFPIAYLHRRLRLLAAGKAASGAAYDADMAVLSSTARQYVLGWPTRLSDGTVARGGAAPGDRCLWADDQFMGLALVSRLAAAPRALDPSGRYLPDELKAELASFAATQQLSFSRRMRDATDGLYYHGVFVAEDASGAETFAPSCCKWGRANGWGMLSHVEVLQALEAQPQQPHPQHAQVLADYQARAAAMLDFQDPQSGRWRQVVNESSTYLETSSTAMALTSLATGVRRGWLASAAVMPAIEAAWAGLAQTVDLTSGVVSGVCMGTGIMPNASGYNSRGTDFFQSSPGGVGTVLRAAAAVAKLHESRAQKLES